MNKCKGLSTLEFTLSALIGAFLVSTAVVSLNVLTRQLAAIKKASLQTKTLVEIRQLLEQGMRDLDTSTLSIAPRIQIGHLSLTDGSELTLANPSHRPANDSSVITFYELDSLGLQFIEERSVQKLKVCQSFNISNRPQLRANSYFALTHSSISEIKIFPELSASPCNWTTISAANSVLADPTYFPIEKFVLKIVPVLRIYSIYRDQASNLRYIGHRAEAIIENQPITHGVEKFELALDFDANLQLYKLKAHVRLRNSSSGTTSVDRAESSWELSHTVARHDIVDLLAM